MGLSSRPAQVYRGGMGGAEALFNGAVVFIASLAACYGLFGWPNRRVLVKVVPQREVVAPPRRRFEDLVVRARVLGPRVRSAPPGIRFAKFDGMRRGYDAVLGELADDLDITHLLTVIPPGPALDTERTRVENAIELAGVDLGLPLV
jgi:hypothetical protein